MQLKDAVSSWQFWLVLSVLHPWPTLESSCPWSCWGWIQGSRETGHSLGLHSVLFCPQRNQPLFTHAAGALELLGPPKSLGLSFLVYNMGR